MTPTIVVPIKSHSRRLKDKNFVNLGGVPLYRWTLDSLKDVDAPILVACNKPEVCEEAESYGYSAIHRPREWDHGTAWDVALHATAAEYGEGNSEHIGLALVTCPFRRASDVPDALAQYEEAAEHGMPLLSAVRVNHRSLVTRSYPFTNQSAGTRGVDATTAWLTTGVIQIARRSHIVDGHVRREGAWIYEVPSVVGLDIDTPLDWCAAFGVVEHKRREKLMEGAA